MSTGVREIVEECINHPTRKSVWSEHQGRYICPEEDKKDNIGKILPDQPDDEKLSPSQPHDKYDQSKFPKKPPLDPQFKLVFLTAAGGTLFFLILCIALHLASGNNPPSAEEKLITGMFDLVKIGFGAIVGLLGGKRL
jgi:hypothetical protein